MAALMFFLGYLIVTYSQIIVARKWRGDQPAQFRDVTAGATGVTAVNALTLFQSGETDSAPPSQRSHQKFPHG